MMELFDLVQETLKPAAMVHHLLLSMPDAFSRGWWILPVAVSGMLPTVASKANSTMPLVI